MAWNWTSRKLSLETISRNKNGEKQTASPRISCRHPLARRQSEKARIGFAASSQPITQDAEMVVSASQYRCTHLAEI
jgi:hypothetical protein